MAKETFGDRLKQAMVIAKAANDDLAEAIGVHAVTVSAWRNDKYLPEEDVVEEIARHLKVAPSWLRYGTNSKRPANGAPRQAPSADYTPGWPEGWQARTYRLALEASEANATEEEIVVVRGWMMDPQLQLLWSGGAPADDRMKELDGIEIGARAWLRARGRMVKAK